MNNVLFFCTLPAAIPCWLFGLLTTMLRLTKDLRWDENRVLSVVWCDWIDERWPFSTALPRMLFYKQDSRDDTAAVDSRIEKHEHVHVRQTEDFMLISFVLGCVIGVWYNDPWMGYAIWSSGATWLLFHYLAAGMRYNRDWYRDAEHERSAYACTNIIEQRHVGRSWLEVFRG